MSDMPDLLDFQYNIRFEKNGQAYRLIHYNMWIDSDTRTFDDIRVMFEGKDLQDTDLSQYKVVAWEDLDQGKFDALVDMKLWKDKDGNMQQIFTLNSLEKVEKQDDQT